MSEDGARCTVEGPRWRGYYKDHEGIDREVTLFADREPSWRRLLEIVRRERDIEAGTLSPAAGKLVGKALVNLLDDWEQAIRDGGASDKQARQARHRVEVTYEAAGAIRPADLTSEGVSRVLARFRREGVPRDPKNKQRPKPLSAQTSNHFLASCKTFVRWCVDAGYLDSDHLGRASGLNVDGQQTFQRRAITADELERLVVSTVGRKSRCDLAGPDRAMVYLTAFYTGFRLNELALLTPADFRLDDTPLIILAAKHTKNKKEARQYLPASVAERLKTYLIKKAKGEPVWTAANYFAGTKAAPVLRRDLRAAGIEVETPDGRIDFHALRASYITALAVAGVPIPHVQKLARHSDPRLTIKHYTRLTDVDLAAAVEKLGRPV